MQKHGYVHDAITLLPIVLGHEHKIAIDLAAKNRAAIGGARGLVQWVRNTSTYPLVRVVIKNHSLSHELHLSRTQARGSWPTGAECPLGESRHSFDVHPVCVKLVRSKTEQWDPLREPYRTALPRHTARRPHLVLGTNREV